LSIPVATVSSSGLATGIDNGSAYIRVTAGALADSVALVVHQRPDAAASTLTAAAAMMFVDDTVRVTLVARDALGNAVKTGDVTAAIAAVADVGVSGLSAPPTVDRGNGTFSADFVGTSAGTPRLIRGTLNGTQVTAAPTLRVVGITRLVANSDDAGTCAILDTADLLCWGEQNAGMRGRGAGAPTVSDPTPTFVTGGLHWATVVPSHNYMCGLTVAGKLYCWGVPSDGQFGSGPLPGLVFTPLAIVPESTFTTLNSHQATGMCALTTAKNTVCWGFGYGGRLGNGADTNVARPVALGGGLKLTAVASTSESGCGVTDASTAFCWGVYGTLGASAPDTCASSGSVPCAKVPVAVGGGLTWKPIITNNAEFACAIATNDKTYCWNNGAAPSEVPGAPAFTTLVTGNLDQCGLTASGAAYCWGRNFSGRFGPVDYNQFVATPVQIANGFTFTQISLGREHTCGLTTAGVAYCWGSNTKGQLGDRTTTASTTPVRVRLILP